MMVNEATAEGTEARRKQREDIWQRGLWDHLGWTMHGWLSSGRMLPCASSAFITAIVCMCIYMCVCM